jgi:hypothetical protein
MELFNPGNLRLCRLQPNLYRLAVVLLFLPPWSLGLIMEIRPDSVVNGRRATTGAWAGTNPHGYRISELLEVPHLPGSHHYHPNE